jgi:hypothetical protein|tara:strand:+ start:2059 stop:2769 length:711 start_codon:yes stop_codon:yes gene_type:complete
MELVAPMVFIPTFKVEPEEDIEETAFISICPTADTEAGPEAKDAAVTVNSGAIAKVAELDKLALASDSETEAAAIVAVEESVELASLVTTPTLETDPVQLIADTDFNVSSGVKDIDPTEDKDAESAASTKGAELTEAEPEMEDTPPMITTPEEGLEPVLVNRLATPNSRIPTSVMEAEADIEDTADIVSTAMLATDPTALRVALPVCSSPLATGREDRGSSLIAPKPSITLPSNNN